MIKAELREWLCVQGHIFWHNAAVNDVGDPLLEIVEAANINAQVRCPCGATSVMEFSLGEISKGDMYPLVRRERVVVPSGKFFDADGRLLSEGATAELEVRNISTLLSALELSEGNGW